MHSRFKYASKSLDKLLQSKKKGHLKEIALKIEELKQEFKTK